MVTAAIRLRGLLRETPNLCEVKTLAEIGTELGISRQRVFQLLPPPPLNRRTIRQQNHLAADSLTLAHFSMEHPRALLSRSRGGPSMKEIATVCGFTADRLQKLWRLCGYPDKRASSLQLVDKAEKARFRWANKPAYRANLTAANARWRRQHPERAKGIARKANAKYYLKNKARKNALRVDNSLK